MKLAAQIFAWFLIGVCILLVLSNPEDSGMLVGALIICVSPVLSLIALNKK